MELTVTAGGRAVQSVPGGVTLTVMDTSVFVTRPVTLGAITTVSLLLATACFTISLPMAVLIVVVAVPRDPDCAHGEHYPRHRGGAGA